jgi:TorA maturation chaperone TorD
MTDKAAPAAARADLCRLLAACYYQPGPEFLEDDVFGSMRAAALQLDTGLADQVDALERSFRSDSIEDLLIDYTRLFLNPSGALAAPYESAWLGNRDPALTQKVLDTVIATYAAGGFEIADDFRDLPDHIAAELEFLYTLIFREARAQLAGGARDVAAAELRRRFLVDHMSRWLPRFTAEVGRSAQTPYFRCLATVTSEFLARESERP